MAKFVIECPVCGRYAEAKTGFFARKKIDCACGNVINVRTDKLTTRVCGHCGNDVVFDQSKGADAKCPVCHQPINTLSDQEKTTEFSCKQCGVRLTTAKSAATYTCPVCDHVNDVAERLKADEIRNSGLASVIKYEGDNETLVWKHPIEDFNLGSQLIVHESQEALFFRDGQALDLFGPGRYTLQTHDLPMLEKIYKLPTENAGVFHSEVYFINMTTQMGIKWGTDSKVRLFDPASGMHVELGASGDFNIRVINSRKLLLKLIGTTGGMTQDQFMGDNGKGFFRTMVMTQVKSFLATVIRESSINVLEIDERLMELSQALMERINPKLAEYGLTMTEFFVARVVTPDEDPNFRRMKEQYAKQYLEVREEQIRKNVAMAAAERKVVEAQSDAEILKIQKQAEADAYRIKAAAEAEEMRMKGYTYQQETARQVGLEAMQNGIGGGASGGLGELAGLGVALGAMGGVIGMTKDAISPMMENTTQMSQTVGGAVAGAWDCACGNKGITAKFCGECGAKKPEPAAGWTCAQCGTANIPSKFCPECGAKKPEPAAGWTCPECGTADIQSKFCPECGHKREG